MALSFTEGSIGGDIESIDLAELETAVRHIGMAADLRTAAPMNRAQPSPGGSNGFAIAPSRSASGHALLWINPHTSFYFRAELQMTSERDCACTARPPGDNSSSTRASTRITAGCTPRTAAMPSTSTPRPSSIRRAAVITNTELVCAALKVDSYQPRGQTRRAPVARSSSRFTAAIMDRSCAPRAANGSP